LLAYVGEEQDLSPRPLDPSIQRFGLSGSWKTDQLNATRLELLHDGLSPVGGAVGDNEYLDELARVVQVKNGLELAADPRLTVAHGQQDGNTRVDRLLKDGPGAAASDHVQQQRVAEQHIDDERRARDE
jgi:hypothetical protein